MQFWTLMFVILAGELLVLKVAYVLGSALVLPTTRGALYVPSSRVWVSAFLDAVPMQPGQLEVS